MIGCRVFSRPDSEEVYARRRDEILTAAENCFVKSGFHRTTIQSIAADARMSVGNVYRYFTSKDSVVEALVLKDQAKMAEDFDSLSADDLMGAFAALMRRQIVDCGPAQSVLWLEICAEATRNPTIASVTRAHEQAISSHLVTFFTRVIVARSARGVATTANPQALASLVITLFCGLMVTQALAPDKGGQAGVEQMLAIVSATIEGHVASGTRADTPLEVYA